MNPDTEISNKIINIIHQEIELINGGCTTAGNHKERYIKAAKRIIYMLKRNKLIR